MSDASQAPEMIVFAGLPGSGKSILAREVAAALGVTFLRIDTCKSAVASTLHSFRGNPVDYVAAEWVGQDQLSAGRSVVVDAVNGSEVARDHWHGLAARTGARLTWVEAVCSDPRENRRRVGQGVPT